MLKIRSAVIPLAGCGTRMFPAATAIEKGLMPIYANGEARPIVDYMVEDCVKAGLERVIFVTTERGKQQLQAYFGELSAPLTQQLKGLGKGVLIEKELARRSAYNLEFTYVVQNPGEYGTAVPPYLAKEALSGEDHFALLGGDDFVYHADGRSDLAMALESYETGETDHLIMGLPIEREKAPRYGVLKVSDNDQLLDFDEKPPLERVPENPVVNISRYLLSANIWNLIEKEMQAQREVGSEHYITYPIIDALKAGQTFKVHRVSGYYIDGGSAEGMLAGSNYINSHPSAS